MSEICYWNSWMLALRFPCPLQGSLNPKTRKSSSCLFYSFTDHCLEVKCRRSFWRIISRAGHWMCIRWGTICLGVPCPGTWHFFFVTTIQLQLCKFACVCRISSMNCGVGDDMPYLCMYFPPNSSLWMSSYPHIVTKCDDNRFGRFIYFHSNRSVHFDSSTLRFSRVAFFNFTPLVIELTSLRTLLFWFTIECVSSFTLFA